MEGEGGDLGPGACCCAGPALGRPTAILSRLGRALCSDTMLARADLLLVAVLVGVLSLLCWLLCWLLVILGCCKICLERLAIGISLHSSMSSAVNMGTSVDEGVLS